MANILALSICRQWWVQCRHLVLGVHFWRVPMILLCMVILLCSTLSIWLGSVWVKIVSGSLSLFDDFLLSGPSSTLSELFSFELEFDFLQWLDDILLKALDEWPLGSSWLFTPIGQEECFGLLWTSTPDTFKQSTVGEKMAEISWFLFTMHMSMIRFIILRAVKCRDCPPLRISSDVCNNLESCINITYFPSSESTFCNWS